MHKTKNASYRFNSLTNCTVLYEANCPPNYCICTRAKRLEKNSVPACAEEHKHDHVSIH